MYISGLPRSASWQDLKDFMRKAGDVVFTDVDGAGNGTVEYSNPEDMENAVRKLDDTEFKNPYDHAYIRVRLAKSGGGSRSASRSRSVSRSRSRDRKRSRSYSRSSSNDRRNNDDADVDEVDKGKGADEDEGPAAVQHDGDTADAVDDAAAVAVADDVQVADEE